MTRAKIKIDAAHSLRLMYGKPVAIRIPRGATVLELRLAPQAKNFEDSFAKICDVVLNGRRA